MAGTFAQKPRGIILHGSRSGQAWSTDKEFDSTRQFAANGAGGLGWHATVGNHEYSIHMTARQWGWSARSASRTHLAVELAQARITDPITDAQVAALIHWYEHEVVPVWGVLDLSQDTALPMHSELTEGMADGKSDAHLAWSDEANDLRRRIRAAL